LAFRKTYTPSQARQKVQHYCAYQERSHAEVRQKLYGYGLWKDDVEALMAELITDDYLNEERFAIAYAGGHFRLKHWGRIKIRYELRQKQVSDYNIKRGLESIDEDDYLKLLSSLAKEKWNSFNNSDQTDFIRSVKTQAYLIQKGFEAELVQFTIRTLSLE
jgi:regulatory protein